MRYASSSSSTTSAPHHSKSNGSSPLPPPPPSSAQDPSSFTITDDVTTTSITTATASTSSSLTSTTISASTVTASSITPSRGSIVVSLQHSVAAAATHRVTHTVYKLGDTVYSGPFCAWRGGVRPDDVLSIAVSVNSNEEVAPVPHLTKSSAHASSNRCTERLLSLSIPDPIISCPLPSIASASTHSPSTCPADGTFEADRRDLNLLCSQRFTLCDRALHRAPSSPPSPPASKWTGERRCQAGEAHCDNINSVHSQKNNVARHVLYCKKKDKPSGLIIGCKAGPKSKIKQNDESVPTKTLNNICNGLNTLDTSKIKSEDLRGIFGKAKCEKNIEDNFLCKKNESVTLRLSENSIHSVGKIIILKKSGVHNSSKVLDSEVEEANEVGSLKAVNGFSDIECSAIVEISNIDSAVIKDCEVEPSPSKTTFECVGEIASGLSESIVAVNSSDTCLKEDVALSSSSSTSLGVINGLGSEDVAATASSGTLLAGDAAAGELIVDWLPTALGDPLSDAVPEVIDVDTTLEEPVLEPALTQVTSSVLGDTAVGEVDTCTVQTSAVDVHLVGVKCETNSDSLLYNKAINGGESLSSISNGKAVKCDKSSLKVVTSKNLATALVTRQRRSSSRNSRSNTPRNSPVPPPDSSDKICLKSSTVLSAKSSVSQKRSKVGPVQNRNNTNITSANSETCKKVEVCKNPSDSVPASVPGKDTSIKVSSSFMNRKCLRSSSRYFVLSEVFQEVQAVDVTCSEDNKCRSTGDSESLSQPLENTQSSSEITSLVSKIEPTVPVTGFLGPDHNKVPGAGCRKSTNGKHVYGQEKNKSSCKSGGVKASSTVTALSKKHSNKVTSPDFYKSKSLENSLVDVDVCENDDSVICVLTDSTRSDLKRDPIHADTYKIPRSNSCTSDSVIEISEDKSCPTTSSSTVSCPSFVAKGIAVTNICSTTTSSTSAGVQSTNVLRRTTRSISSDSRIVTLGSKDFVNPSNVPVFIVSSKCSSSTVTTNSIATAVCNSSLNTCTVTASSHKGRGRRASCSYIASITHPVTVPNKTTLKETAAALTIPEHKSHEMVRLLQENSSRVESYCRLRGSRTTRRLGSVDSATNHEKNKQRLAVRKTALVCCGSRSDYYSESEESNTGSERLGGRNGQVDGSVCNKVAASYGTNGVSAHIFEKMATRRNPKGGNENNSKISGNVTDCVVSKGNGEQNSPCANLVNGSVNTACRRTNHRSNSEESDYSSVTSKANGVDAASDRLDINVLLEISVADRKKFEKKKAKIRRKTADWYLISETEKFYNEREEILKNKNRPDSASEDSESIDDGHDSVCSNRYKINSKKHPKSKIVDYTSSDDSDSNLSGVGRRKPSRKSSHAVDNIKSEVDLLETSEKTDHRPCLGAKPSNGKLCHAPVDKSDNLIPVHDSARGGDTTDPLRPRGRGRPKGRRNRKTLYDLTRLHEDTDDDNFFSFPVNSGLGNSPVTCLSREGRSSRSKTLLENTDKDGLFCSKKRLSDAERFLRDNRYYYQFPETQERLRTTHDKCEGKERKDNGTAVDGTGEDSCEEVSDEDVEKRRNAQRQRSKGKSRSPSKCRSKIDVSNSSNSVDVKSTTTLTVTATTNSNTAATVSSAPTASCKKNSSDSCKNKKVITNKAHLARCTRGRNNGHQEEEVDVNIKEIKEPAEISSEINKISDPAKKTAKVSCIPPPGMVKEIVPLCTNAVDELIFSFEQVPEAEPWYQTYQRQIDHIKDNEYTKEEDALRFILPYEMPKEYFRDHIARRNLANKKRADLAELVRKSPRCHASTLALFSDILPGKHKKVKSKNTGLPSVVKEEDQTTSDGTSTPGADSSSRLTLGEHFETFDDYLAIEHCMNVVLKAMAENKVITSFDVFKEEFAKDTDNENDNAKVKEEFGSCSNKKLSKECDRRDKKDFKDKSKDDSSDQSDHEPKMDSSRRRTKRKRQHTSNKNNTKSAKVLKTNTEEKSCISDFGELLRSLNLPDDPLSLEMDPRFLLEMRDMCVKSEIHVGSTTLEQTTQELLMGASSCQCMDPRQHYWDDLSSLDDNTEASSECLSLVDSESFDPLTFLRTGNKKRRKNLTGWPKVKRKRPAPVPPSDDNDSTAGVDDCKRLRLGRVNAAVEQDTERRASPRKRRTTCTTDANPHLLRFRGHK